MEAVILFLLKAAASGTAGHYIKKALTKIDSEVGAMFERGASVKEIERKIEQKQVTTAVENVFQESIKSSTILSDDLSVAATPDDKIAVIESIIRIGFKIARTENFDLVLPGSPLGSKSISIFECSNAEQDVTVNDRSILWNQFRASLYIAPVSSTDLKSYWASYLDSVRELRSDSKTRRLKMGSDFSPPIELREFKVQCLTAGTVYYVPQIVSPERKSAYRDWDKGIIAMLNGTKKIKDLNYLPLNEWNRVKATAMKIKDL